MNTVEEKIKNFSESTMTDDKRFPGMMYFGNSRINEMSDQQLLFQRELLVSQGKYLASGDDSAVSEADIDYSLKAIDEELRGRFSEANSVVWRHNECPYFTIQEINLNEHVARISDRRDKIIHGAIIPERSYASRIRDLEERLRRTEDPDEIAEIKRDMILMGWNPEVDCTNENMIKAMDRIERIYTNEMNDFCTIIDVSECVDTFKEDVSYPDNGIAALYIQVTEGGDVVVSNGIMIESSDIYCVFVKPSYASSVFVESGVFNETFDEETIFTLPSNYACYCAVKNICESFGFKQRPLIYKLHDHKNDDEVISEQTLMSIANYVNHCMEHEAIDNTRDFEYYTKAVVLS